MRRLALVLLLAGLALVAYLVASQADRPGTRPVSDGAAGGTGETAPHLLGSPPRPKPEAPTVADASSPTLDALPPADRWEITGHVVEEGGGAGVAVVRVRLLLVRGDREVDLGGAVTGPDGSFRHALPPLDGLSEAQIAVSFLRVFVRADGWHPAHEQDPSLHALGPRLNARRVVVRIPVWKRRTFHGRVLDGDGRPVSGARLRTGWWGTSTSRSVSGGWKNADPDGVYVLEARTHAKGVHVYVRKSGTGSARISVPFDPEDPPKRLPDLVLEGPGWIRGRALFPDGSPASGLLVYCSLTEGIERGTATSPPGSTTSTDWTDAEGRFVLAGLCLGRGRAGVAHPQTLRRPSGIPPVDVATGDGDVVLRVPVPRVRLHVEDETGAPLPGAHFRARVVGDRWPDVQQGTLRTPSAVGCVWGHFGDTVHLVVHGGGLRVAEATVRLAPDLWTQDVTCVLSPWREETFGSLRIAVRHATGEPVAAVKATLHSPLVGLRLVDLFLDPVKPDTGAVPVPPGRWLLKLRPPGSGGPRWARQEHEVVIRSGEETLVRTIVRRGGRLRLELEVPGGHGNDLRWRAVLTPDDGAVSPIERVSGPRKTYEWRLAAGRWSLDLEAPGYRTAHARAVLRDGEVVDLEIPLEKE